ncbi:hypothetical protein RRG08_046046 [Elysia crispata]|uniref:Uncharacterized protein n=1 Tax=Elysia crispata TaxID=231223 RepID=A0AAE1DUK5_9GAST|nr:hypothetical protein RRG08_046046 [Elysia crispata]
MLNFIYRCRMSRYTANFLRFSMVLLAAFSLVPDIDICISTKLGRVAIVWDERAIHAGLDSFETQDAIAGLFKPSSWVSSQK